MKKPGKKQRFVVKKLAQLPKEVLDALAEIRKAIAAADEKERNDAANLN